MKKYNPAYNGGTGDDSGCRYYSDAGGTTTIIPSAGTVAIQGKDATTDQFTDMSGTPLTANDITDRVSATANLTEVRATPTTITTATHYQLFVTSNV